MSKHEQTIYQLIKESSMSSSNSLGRPDLVALTRAATNLIYTDIVAIQPTTQPIAAIFGVKYTNPNDEMTFKSAATYSGQVSSREGIPEAENKAYKSGDLFKLNDVVYEVVSDTPFDATEFTELQDIITEAVINGTIRFKSDAASVEKYETDDSISEIDFSIDKWQVPVRSRKLKTKYTLELIQDMNSSQLDGSEVVYDMLSTVIAGEINKDIIQKLITVSKRYKVQGVSDKGILDVSGDEAQDAGRKIYRYIAEMNGSIMRNSSFKGTYVLASTRVIAILDASGLLKENEDNDRSVGKLSNGLEVFADTTTPMDYFIVGVKAEFGELEHVGSLFYAPYVDLDDAGAFKVVIDPDSLQPEVAVLLRYALSVNPFTTVLGDKSSGVIQGDDWNNLVGVSDMSMLLGVKLPALVK